ncbi:MAG: DsbA family protein [Patescibacteria group bacterium]|nr:DsbA family protein [Patescibacteria group bacterium]
MSQYNNETPSQGPKGVFASLSPRASFVTGLVGGVMLLCTIGFFVLLTVYIQGGMDNSKDTNGSVAGTEKVNTNANTNAQVNTNQAAAVPEKIDYTVTDQDYVRGKADAKVTILEWSDFQCPYCSKFHDTMNQLLEKYPNDVRWVFKHFPLDFHAEAQPAALAAECAAEQKGNDGFWSFSDELYANQDSLGADFYVETATKLGLNIDKFNDCVSSDKYADKIDADAQLGISKGVQGTPGNFLNNESLGGAVPYATLEAEVKQLLSK